MIYALPELFVRFVTNEIFYLQVRHYLDAAQSDFIQPTTRHVDQRMDNGMLYPDVTRKRNTGQ